MKELLVKFFSTLMEIQKTLGVRATNQPIVLYNLILPLLFLEVWSVSLAFIGVVVIEALIIKTELKTDFINVLKQTIWINFLTTILGYIGQGIIRYLCLSIVGKFVHPKAGDVFWYNPVVLGFLGNVPWEGAYHKYFFAAIADISTSFIITFIISVVVETKYLRKAYGEDEKIQRLIPSAVLKANIASYALLLIWVLYYIRRW